MLERGGDRQLHVGKLQHVSGSSALPFHTLCHFLATDKIATIYSTSVLGIRYGRTELAPNATTLGACTVRLALFVGVRLAPPTTPILLLRLSDGRKAKERGVRVSEREALLSALAANRPPRQSRDRKQGAQGTSLGELFSDS